MTIAIEGTGLHKRFVKARSVREMLVRPFERAERIEALRGVDLSIEQGEIFGLLGPNGAGKTTLLKILSCLVLPDEGRALVGGHDTRDENRVKRLIGLVNSDERSFYWRLSGRENLEFFARLYDVPRNRCRSRIDELLGRVDMAGAADRPFSGYSSGMKQRMAIVRALLHDPPILLMDEPTRSLDPASALELRGFVDDQLRGRDGKTILITSHNLREVEALADRVAILIRGRVCQTGSVDEIRRWGIDRATYRLEFPATHEPPAGPFRVVDRTDVEGLRRVTVELVDGAGFNDLMSAFIEARIPVAACDRHEPDLEDAFSRILQAAKQDA